MIFFLLLFLFYALPNAFAAVDQISDDLNDVNVGATSTVHFAASPTAGCLIVVGLVGYNAAYYGTPTVADDQKNSYTVVTYSSPGSITAMPVYAYAEKVAANVADITITHENNSGNYVRARGVSICGETAIDRSGETQNLAGTSTTVTAAAANTNAHDFVFAVIQVSVSSTDVHLGRPATVGYTVLMTEQNHASYVAGGIDYKEVSSLETSDATWTHDSVSGSGGATALIASFKLTPTSTAKARRSPIIWQ